MQRDQENRSQQYLYNPDSNQLQSSDQIQFRPNTLNPGTQQREFIYNDQGRLYQIIDDGQLIASYIYNANGQRSRKTTQQGTTLFHYNLSGKLLSESDKIWGLL